MESKCQLVLPKFCHKEIHKILLPRYLPYAQKGGNLLAKPQIWHTQEYKQMLNMHRYMLKIDQNINVHFF